MSFRFSTSVSALRKLTQPAGRRGWGYNGAANFHTRYRTNPTAMVGFADTHAGYLSNFKGAAGKALTTAYFRMKDDEEL